MLKLLIQAFWKLPEIESVVGPSGSPKLSFYRVITSPRGNEFTEGPGQPLLLQVITRKLWISTVKIPTGYIKVQVWDTGSNASLNALHYFFICPMLTKLCSYPLLARKASWKLCTNNFPQTYAMDKDGGFVPAAFLYFLFSILSHIVWTLQHLLFFLFCNELREYCSLTRMLMHITKKYLRIYLTVPTCQKQLQIYVKTHRKYCYYLQLQL